MNDFLVDDTQFPETFEPVVSPKKAEKMEKLVDLKGDLHAKTLAESVLQLCLRDFVPDDASDSPETIQRAVRAAVDLARRYHDFERDSFVTDPSRDRVSNVQSSQSSPLDMKVDAGTTASSSFGIASTTVSKNVDGETDTTNSSDTTSNSGDTDEAANETKKGDKGVTNGVTDEVTSVVPQRDYYVLQIRSVPVRDFGYLLRHYFVRIDELIEIHPGNEQRVVLRGWHTATDLATDRLEANYELCFDCFNDAISVLWRSMRGFNFSFKNCDHNCNASQQSIGVAFCLFAGITSFGVAVFQGVWMFFLMILLSFAVFFVFLYYGQTAQSNFVRLLPAEPLAMRCSHLDANRAVRYVPAELTRYTWYRGGWYADQRDH